MVTLTVSLNDEQIYENTYYEDWYMPVMLEESEYEAGDEITITVLYDWVGRMSRDYTVSVYSKQDLEVLDEDGNTNMIHMDG